MGVFSFIGRKGVKDYTSYKEERMGTIEFPDRLTNENAFRLANTVAEIYWAVDFLADRVSKLEFYIGDKEGERRDGSASNRLLKSTNPFFSFNDLVYQALFSLLSDGQAYIWPQSPSLLGGIATPNSITRTDIIQPSQIALREYTNVSMFDVNKYTDIIADAWLNTGAGMPRHMTREEINNLYIVKMDGNIRSSSLFLSESPLFRAVRPINSLLAVYSARYNSYVNNGMAGILYKKSRTSGSTSLEGAINGSNSDRQKMVDDITNRNGITGKRNFIAITDQDVAFINTLASIKDLMPLEETLETSIKIAATMQIPAGLVPRKDGQTFDNQNIQERTVWENALMSITETICDAFTKAWRLKDEKICASYESVSCLSENASAREELTGKQLENIETLGRLMADVTLSPAIKNVLTQTLKEYEEGK